MHGTRLHIHTSEVTDRNMEAESNRFNLKCLAVVCCFSVLCSVCNLIGVFAVDQLIMQVAAAATAVFCCLPIAIWQVHDRLLKKSETILLWSGFKYLIIASVFCAVSVTCVALTFEAVLLLVLPGIFAAQYPSRKRLRRWTIIGLILLVPIGVYGGFFFGMADMNMFAGAVPAGTIQLADRIAAFTPERCLSLVTHYVVPRYLSLLVIQMLLFGINRRNALMTRKQMELSETANAEMDKRNTLQNAIIDRLSSVIESRDENTGEHVLRTKNYVRTLAEAMARDRLFEKQLTPEVVEEIVNAAPLHDIGKIAIPDAILLKPGRLTPAEFEVIKGHAQKGGAMIRTLFADLDDPLFKRMAEEITVYHHEWWNGSGYPRGLKGREIPLSARIMAVADVYDALISNRVYKKAIPREEALEIIYSESGTHFDPDIIRILRKCVQRDRAREEHKE